ncbi:hypothetical protein OPIT5_15700 [Opitutaceae bacterium TAV5]|nr:hypothetical protein OPIT5_15700 [Opitutaceae bacterium TAV5]
MQHSRTSDRPLAIVIIATFAVWFSSGLAAATIKWDGGGGNSTWTTPTNWSGDILPTSADDVTFDINTGMATSGTQVDFGSSVGARSITVDLAAFRLNAVVSRSFTLGSATDAGSFILTDRFTTDSTVFDSNNSRAITVEFHNDLSLVNRGTGTAFVGTDTAGRMARIQSKDSTTGTGVITFGGSGNWTFRSNSYLGKHAGNTTQTLAVVLAGSGADAFTGVLEYGGATAASVDTLAIDSGTFRLKNATAIAAAGVTVGANGTLDGIGSVEGDITIEGKLAAGLESERGQLAFTRNLTLADTAITTLRIESGNTNDSLLGAAGGVFTQDGALVISGADAIAAEGQWILFSGFGSIAGEFTSVTLSGLGDLAWDSASNRWSGQNLRGFDWSLDATSGLLAATGAIPEPAAVALLFGCLAATAVAIRRRRA